MGVKDGSEKSLQVNNGYAIKIIIDGQDYEPDTKQIRIVSSFKSSYPIFLISLDLKPLEVINDKILGQNDISLSIIYKENGIPKWTAYEVDLLYLSGEFDYPVSNQMITNTDAIQDQCPFVIRAVPRDAFKVFTYNINKIYTNTSPFLVVNDLVMEAMDNIKTDYLSSFVMDDDNVSLNEIEQIMLPPTILKNHIDYMFEEFGLYKSFGALFATIPEDNNFAIQYNGINLGNRLANKSASKILKFIQLANDVDTDEIVNNYIHGKDKNYPIFSGVHTNYIANTTFSNFGRHNYFIHKPVDKFYRIDHATISDYMGELYQESSLYDEPYISESLTERSIYKSHHICHNRDLDNHPISGDEFQDEYWMASQINKVAMNMFQLSLNVERNFKLFHFTDIGQPVEFESLTSEYQSLNGRYILYSSDITLLRKAEWSSTAAVQLIRPTWGNPSNG